MTSADAITGRFLKGRPPEAKDPLCRWFLAAILCLLLDACSPGSQKAAEVSSNSSDVTAIEQIKSEAIEQSVAVQKLTSASEADDDALPSLMDYAKAEEAMTAGTEMLRRGQYQEAHDQFAIAATIDSENEEIF